MTSLRLARIRVLKPDFTVDYITSVPDGYAGGQGLAPFLARVGTLNLNLSDGSVGGTEAFGANAWIGSKNKNSYVEIGLESNLNNSWIGRIEYRRSTSKVIGQPSYDLRGNPIFVPAAAPINPFGALVQVRFYDPRLERPDIFKRETIDTEDHLGASIRGKISDWKAIIDYSYNRITAEGYNAGFLPNVLNSSWNNAFLLGLYNPFVDMRTTAPAAPEFYSNYIIQELSHANADTSHQLLSKVSGPLFNLPGGEVNSTVGLEWFRVTRDDRQFGTTWRNSVTKQYVRATPDVLSRITRYKIPQVGSTRSVYSEVNIPIVSKAMSKPVISAMELFVSGRIDRQDLHRGEGTADVIQTTEENGALLRGHITEKYSSYRNTPWLYSSGFLIGMDAC